MALPQRTPSWYEDAAQRDSLGAVSEPLISIGYPELFGVDDVDAAEPWCVDHGDGMDVMSTARIRAALDAGELSWTTKVWRDGNGFWHEIGELPELVGDAAYERQPAEPSIGPSDEFEEEPVEHSTIRRVQRSSWGDREDIRSVAPPRAARIATLPSLTVVLVALALLLLPSAGYLAARVVGGQDVSVAPLRSKAQVLADRVARQDLMVRIQPFPSGVFQARSAPTYRVPLPSSPGRHSLR